MARVCARDHPTFSRPGPVSGNQITEKHLIPGNIVKSLASAPVLSGNVADPLFA
jgi:hypothetical protein